jgi:hypothetical protein
MEQTAAGHSPLELIPGLIHGPEDMVFSCRYTLTVLCLLSGSTWV